MKTAIVAEYEDDLGWFGSGAECGITVSHNDYNSSFYALEKDFDITKLEDKMKEAISEFVYINLSDEHYSRLIFAKINKWEMVAIPMFNGE